MLGGLIQSIEGLKHKYYSFLKTEKFFLNSVTQKSCLSFSLAGACPKDFILVAPTN